MLSASGVYCIFTTKQGEQNYLIWAMPPMPSLVITMVYHQRYSCMQENLLAQVLVVHAKKFCTMTTATRPLSHPVCVPGGEDKDQQTIALLNANAN
jgi:hypothetical protein